ncbi:MAG: DUF429 domain-containing protein [Pseudomonadota bacterium]
MSAQPLVAGVDGAPGGFAVVTLSAEGPIVPKISLAGTFQEVLDTATTIAIDIPIGFPDAIEGPGRVAEQAVRPLLGARQSSVFSMPSREVVYADTYGEACEKALATSTPPRKVSKQAFAIFGDIRLVDRVVTPANQHRVFECHAELAFWRLNGEAVMATPKRVKGVPMREGLGERIALLVANGYPEAMFDKSPSKGMPLIDLVDAAAIALIARRCHKGEAVPFPDPPGVDGRGLRIAIWA